jgi:hypothetical protein
MKLLYFVIAAIFPLLVMVLIMRITEMARQDNLSGHWQYEETIVAQNGENPSAYRMDLDLAPGGKVVFKIPQNAHPAEVIEGVWTAHDDLLVMTRSDGSFSVLKIKQVTPTDLHVVNGAGKVLDFVKTPSGTAP